MNSDVIKYVAGGGKTSSSKDYLKKNKNGLYLAFNNNVVDELKKNGYLCRTIDALFTSYIIPKLIALIPIEQIKSNIKYVDCNTLKNNRKGISSIKIDKDGNLYNKSKRIDNISLYTKNIELRKSPKFTNSLFVKYIFGENDLNLTDSLRADLSTFLLEKHGDKIVKLLQKRFDYIIIDEAQDLSGYREKFAQLLYKSNIKLILLGDENQNINGGGKWFESLPPTKKENRSLRCPEKVCEWIRINLHIEIYGTKVEAKVNLINTEEIKEYDDGIKCLLYNASTGSIKSIIDNWSGPTSTIKGAKGSTIKTDIVIIGKTLNKKNYYTALTRTTKNIYTTIK